MRKVRQDQDRFPVLKSGTSVSTVYRPDNCSFHRGEIAGQKYPPLSGAVEFPCDGTSAGTAVHLLSQASLIGKPGRGNQAPSPLRVVQAIRCNNLLTGKPGHR